MFREVSEPEIMHGLPQTVDLRRIEAAFSSRKHHWIVESQARGDRLLQFLRERLPHIEADSWPERMAIGGVYVNGLVALQDIELPHPCKVEYYEPKVALADLATCFAGFADCRILYRDEYLAAVWKPSRLSCMPAKEQQRYNLKTYLEQHFGCTIHMPSRLDMSTQGIVLFSISPKCHRPLQQAFEKRKINKRYLALVETRPRWRFLRFSAPIGKHPRHEVLRSVCQVGAESSTIFRRCDGPDDGANTLLLARPVTGRTHQIRVHLSHLGHPILGDRFYGGAPHDKLCLLSYSVSLRHPITNEPLEIRTPPDLLPDWVDRHELDALAHAELL